VPVVWPQGSIPLTDGKPGQAIDVAKVIRFLLSAEASHMTGSSVFVDGGQARRLFRCKMLNSRLFSPKPDKKRLRYSARIEISFFR
jgi:hypothetical protein